LAERSVAVCTCFVLSALHGRKVPGIAVWQPQAMEAFGNDDEEVLQKLKARNRQLHEELQRLVSINESVYEKKVNEVKDACRKRLEEQKAIHSQESSRKIAELQELRAGSMIAWSLFTSKKGMLSKQLKADQALYADFFEEYRKEKKQLEASQFEEIQSAEHKLAKVISDYEEQLAAHKADADSKIHGLESELKDACDEGRRLHSLVNERQREFEMLTKQRHQQQLEIEQLEARVAAPRARIKKIQLAAQRRRNALEREIGDYTHFLDDNLQKQQELWDSAWSPESWPAPPPVGSPRIPMLPPPPADGAVGVGIPAVVTTSVTPHGLRQERLPLLLQPRRLPPLS